jgi:CheY-like chemotaxis protein
VSDSQISVGPDPDYELGAERRRRVGIPAATSTRDDSDLPLRGVRILIVEDDAGSRKLASVLLSEAGAEVVAVRSAEEALTLIEAEPPHAIVLDLLLPGLSGLDLVRALKANEATRDIQVIAVTSLNGPEAERTAIEAGCTTYMRKPIDGEIFVATIVNLVGGKK